MDKKLFNELERRFKEDQRLSKSGFGDRYVENCKENAEWLKEVIREKGWPSEEIVGKQGELYAWLIAQHADHDIDFQRQVLEILQNLPEKRHRKPHIAYLNDRIAVAENRKQTYGTQFGERGLWPVKDEENLDKRRANMSLEPFKEYLKEYKKMEKEFNL